MCVARAPMPGFSSAHAVTALVLSLLLLSICSTADTTGADDGETAGAAVQPTTSAGSAGAVADQTGSSPILVFLKLRPSKSRTKADVVAVTSKWKPAAWGGQDALELSVIDRDAVVITAKSVEAALKVKDWVLTQQLVYEVELNQGDDTTYRRPGDVPIEELRRGLSRNAHQERRQKGWAWLLRTAREQGVKIRRPRRRRPLAGARAGRQRQPTGGKKRIAGANRDEL